MQVESVEVQTANGSPNVLNTYWSKATVNIANGLDFQHGGDLLVKFTMLQHDEFKYKIIVNNSSGLNKLGTCRILMSSKYDDDGKPWKFSEQKIMFIELDKFKVTCEYARFSRDFAGSLVYRVVHQKEFSKVYLHCMRK